MRAAKKRFPLVVLGVIALGPSAVFAQWSTTIGSDPAVSVRAESPFEEAPRSGYLPIRVTIENAATSAATYDLRATATFGYGMNREAASTAQQLRVPARGSASADLLLPIAPREPGSGLNRQFNLSVTGPGVSSTTNLNGSGIDGKNAFVAMSSDLSVRSWSPLRVEAEKSGKQVAGSEFDPQRLGSDWRALAGVGSLWISASEFDRLRPDQRRAITDWIAQGGRMFWVVQTGSTRTLAEFGAPVGSARPHRIGLGEIRQREWNGRELDVDETLAVITEPGAVLETTLATGYTNWNPAGDAGRVRLPVALLVTFISLFAIVVGPVNLFWFAGAGRRHRLFWTTPVISLVASVVLGATILVQDGMGGSGYRVSYAFADPSSNQLILRQEQVSRTGLLLNRTAELAEPAFVSPLDLKGSDTEPVRDRSQNGLTLGGEWFMSRAVQGQYLEAIIPARARVERVAGGAGSEPTLLSTLPHTLDQIFYLDGSGAWWTGGPLRTGEKITLSATTPAEADRFMTQAAAQAGPLVRDAWMANFPVNGSFFGVGADGPFLETLPAIRWDNGAALVSGPVVDANANPASASAPSNE